MSDARRERLNELWEIAGHLSPIQEDQVYNVGNEGIHLLQEEGHLVDTEDFFKHSGSISSEGIYDQLLERLMDQECR